VQQVFVFRVEWVVYLEVLRALHVEVSRHGEITATSRPDHLEIPVDVDTSSENRSKAKWKAVSTGREQTGAAETAEAIAASGKHSNTALAAEAVAASGFHPSTADVEEAASACSGCHTTAACLAAVSAMVHQFHLCRRRMRRRR
jgi:hypothetical protein